MKKVYATLRDEYLSKRKTNKMLGILFLAIIFLLGVIGVILNNAGIHFLDKGSAMSPVMGGIIIVLLVFSIIFFVRFGKAKKALVHLCPNCGNHYGEEQERELVSDEGYVQVETSTHPFWGTEQHKFKRVSTKKVYDALFECPSCKHQWVDKVVEE